MPWIKIKGMAGRLYMPGDGSPVKRKHNCRDCYSCQNCSDTRCGECLMRKTCARRKKHCR